MAARSPVRMTPAWKRKQRRSAAATEAGDNLSSLVGEGPSPTRRNEDRPAQQSADQEAKEKTGFSANSAQKPAIDNAAAMRAARRFALLHVFVRAGRAILSHLAPSRKANAAIPASKCAAAPPTSKLPAPCRPLHGRGKEPPPSPNTHA